MAEGSRPIYDLPIVSDDFDVLQFPVDQNNVAKRVYATDLAEQFKNTVILENTIQNMDLSVSLTAGEIYDLVKAGQIVLFDSGFLESNSTVSCLFPIHRVEKNGNDYTAFVYVQNDIDDPVYEYAIDKFGGVNLIGESSGGGGGTVGVLSETHTENGVVTLFLSGGSGTLIASDNSGNITLLVG